MNSVSESTWARLSAIGVVALVALIALAGMAGKPPPPRPMPTPEPTFGLLLQAAVTEAPTALTPTPSAEAPLVVSLPTLPDRHRIMGEDGIFGLPGWPWRANDNPRPTPPRYAFKWLSQSWPGPGRKLTR